MIDISNLLCPKCSSDFLEEGKMGDSGLDLPRLQESLIPLRSLESNDLGSGDTSTRPEFNMHNFFRFMRNHNLISRENQRISEYEEDERDSSFEDIIEIMRSHRSGSDFIEVMRNRRRQGPPTAEVIESIESIYILEKMGECDCKICGENFKVDEEAKILECEHLFHDACLSPWLRIKNSCPVCRHSIE